MADKKWEWTPEGALLLNGVSHTLKPAKKREAIQLSAMVHQWGEVWAGLAMAKKSFATGSASYIDCFQNLTELVKGHAQAEEAVEHTLAEIGGYFEPANPFKDLNTDDRMRMAIETIQKLGTAAKE